MAINQKHPEYDKLVNVITRIRDAIAGRDAVIGKSVAYLPQLEGQLAEDYNAYLTRSVWTNYSARIRNIMVSQIFKQDPEIQGIQQDIKDNFDLAGTSLNYWAKQICNEIITAYRVGVFIDYSDDQQRPYGMMFKAEDIINWRTRVINGTEQLTLVVLEKEIDVPDKKEKYKCNKVKIWRELYLDGLDDQTDDTGMLLDENISITPVYKVRDWQKKDQSKIAASLQGDKYEIIKEFVPMMNDSTLDYIPFYFFTPDGISTKLGKPPILDIVDQNYSIYRTAADLENASYYYGNPTLITKNFGQDGKKKFPLGGWADFGADGDAKFLELSPSQFLVELLEKKIEQISMLSSSMLHGSGRYVASEATSTTMTLGENAVIKDLSNAMDTCVTAIMFVIAEWGGEETEANEEGEISEVVVEFPTNIEEDAPIDANLGNFLIAAYQQNIISYDTLFYNLQGFNLFKADLTAEEEMELINKSIDSQIELRNKKIYSDPVKLAMMKGIKNPQPEKGKGNLQKDKSQVRQDQDAMPNMQEAAEGDKFKG